MHMPVHMFISMSNILATQFQKEEEAQKEAKEKAEMNTPNFNVPDFSSMLNNLNIHG